MDFCIVGQDKDLDMEMANSTPSNLVQIGDGVAVTWEVPMYKSGDYPKMIDVAVQVLEAVPAGVAANIVTNWIMGRFKGRAEKVVVERQEMEFDDGKLKRVIQETITRERGS